jgi:Ran GTPase-activating protein (RanGAP) involved in mRNA processing and transport
MLNLAQNNLTDECISDLCKALQNEHCKLNEVNLAMNKLTNQCIPHLCEVLKSKSKLTDLSLAQNRDITDEALRMLCQCSLPEGQQKNRKLNLFGCSLTNNCIRYLRNAVGNEHFILKELILAKSVFSNEEQEHLHQLETSQTKFELV